MVVKMQKDSLLKFILRMLIVISIIIVFFYFAKSSYSTYLITHEEHYRQTAKSLGWGVFICIFYIISYAVRVYFTKYQK